MPHFRQLQDLFATNNRIHDLSCLPNVVPKLEVLDLSENEISDWDEMVGSWIYKALQLIWQNQLNDMCTQCRLRSAWPSTQSNITA